MFKNSLCLVVLCCCPVLVSAVEMPASQLAANAAPQSQSANLRLSRWHDLIGMKGRFNSEKELVVAVDDYINHLEYQPDAQLQSDVDQWASPWDFVASGKGDCEDFAIAKLFTLQAMGVPIKRLRLVYAVRSYWQDQHMVVVYYPKDNTELWILDNLARYITLAGQRPDLQPVFSFTPQNAWVMHGWQKTVAAGYPLNLPKWNRITRSWQIKLQELAEL